jgi:hypothetical protein
VVVNVFLLGIVDGIMDAHECLDGLVLGWTGAWMDWCLDGLVLRWTGFGSACLLPFRGGLMVAALKTE